MLKIRPQTTNESLSAGLSTVSEDTWSTLVFGLLTVKADKATALYPLGIPAP